MSSILTRKSKSNKISFKIAVIAPSGSINEISSLKLIAAGKLYKEFGIEIVYGQNCIENDLLGSSAIKSRVDDLHWAFMDKDIKAIMCATGGYNSNDLLPYIDWQVIKNNPKPFIGSSDITVLINAIYKKTGVMTYFGPNFYKFGAELGLEYTLDYFYKSFFLHGDYSILPSSEWSEDKWYKNQKDRHFILNKGYVICNPGIARGKIIGGNLCSLNLLQGTEYMPDLDSVILCVEDDDLAGVYTFGEFYRNLHSLFQQPNASKIKGVLIGRFLSNSNMTLDKIKFVVNSFPGLKNIPVIANVDFGHTEPIITFPIGGIMEIKSLDNKVEIAVLRS